MPLPQEKVKRYFTIHILVFLVSFTAADAHQQALLHAVKKSALKPAVLEAIHFANKAIATHKLGIAQRIPDRSAGLTE